MKTGLRVTQTRLAEFAVLAFLFVLSLVIRGTSLSNLVASPDELTYASRAVYILGAHWAWPAFTMWDQPPLFEYILAFVTVAFGATIETLRWVSVIFGSLAVIAVYYLGKSLYGRTAGLVAAAIIAFDPFQILYSRQIYIESEVSTIMLFAILLFWEGVVKRKNLKIAVLGGIAFGLALDSKYIILVMAVAMVVFLVIYRSRIPGGFPRREVLAYFATGVIMFVPVLLDLAASNVNPFYFDLVGRFQLHGSSSGGVAKLASAGAAGGGAILYIGFKNFIQTFFRFSPGNPIAVYPATALDIPVWIVVGIFVFVFFVGSFLFRRNPREGMLLILFVAFLGFAFSYPGKRTYFTLYPMLIFVVMLGGLVQICADRWRQGGGEGLDAGKLLAICLIGLTATGIVINAFGAPVTHEVGFGDWDDMTPIVAYINVNHGTNSYVAINLALVGYYVAIDNVNVSIAWMDQEQYYYSESPGNQSLQVIQEGQYPLYKVMSLSVVELMKPQFVVIPASYYLPASAEFKQYMVAHYYQPLSTVHILLFQLRPTNGTG